MKELLLSVTALVALSASASAADLLAPRANPVPVSVPAPRFFLEGSVGAGFGTTDELEFTDPLGTNITSNPVSGGRILLSDQDNGHSDVAAAIVAGYYFTPNFYAKAAYRYFGQHDFRGYAGFIGNDYEEHLAVSGHGVFVGVGATFDIGPAFFIDASVEVGGAFLDSKGTEGANLGLDSRYPDDDKTNLAAGASLGLGYHMTQNLDLMVTGTYHYLGEAQTGVAPGGGGLNPDQQLKADLNVFTVQGGLRFKM